MKNLDTLTDKQKAKTDPERFPRKEVEKREKENNERKTRKARKKEENDSTKEMKSEKPPVVKSYGPAVH
jgi:hypothetical protein